MKHVLEGSKLFPYIAWITFIMFSLFLFQLTRELQKSATFLNDKTQQNLAALDELDKVHKHR